MQGLPKIYRSKNIRPEPVNWAMSSIRTSCGSYSICMTLLLALLFLEMSCLVRLCRSTEFKNKTQEICKAFFISKDNRFYDISENWILNGIGCVAGIIADYTVLFNKATEFNDATDTIQIMIVEFDADRYDAKDNYFYDMLVKKLRGYDSITAVLPMASISTTLTMPGSEIINTDQASVTDDVSNVINVSARFVLGVISKYHLSLIDDAIDTIAAKTDALGYVRIVEGASDNDPEVDTKNLTTDQILILHAVGYGVTGNCLGDFSVNWSMSGGIGTPPTNSGVTTTFDSRTSGLGVISADYPIAGVGDDVINTITVLRAWRKVCSKLLRTQSYNTNDWLKYGLSDSEYKALPCHFISFTNGWKYKEFECRLTSVDNHIYTHEVQPGIRIYDVNDIGLDDFSVIDSASSNDFNSRADGSIAPNQKVKTLHYSLLPRGAPDG